MSAPRGGPIEAIVFDFDGLILDTEVPVYRSWQEIYEAHGCELPLSTWAVCIGTDGAFDPHQHLEAQLGRALDAGALEARHRERCDALIAREAVRPGVLDYLAEARRLGLKRGVASSSSRRWVAGHLERLGMLEAFHALRCAGEVPRVKPAPDLYRAVLAELGVAPARALAIEDSPNGIRAAKGAGMFCVAVPNALTRHLDLGEADLHLTSLAELPLGELLSRAARGDESGSRALA
ncbi:MAG TPA: HAD family hydrolase [Vicinamibacteria bacterium]|nr:HAD family hydrolase [Vicinamibacteria bacterium]